MSQPLPSRPPESDPPAELLEMSRAEAAAYVRDMSVALTRLARAHHLSLLAYLLEMAALEADRKTLPGEG